MEYCVDLWNSLPPNVVNAQTVRSFEGRLDKFWYNQEIKTQYRANVITGLHLTNEDLDDEDPELVLQE